MSIPGNINPAPPPSSFDGDETLKEVGFIQTIKKRAIREPLVPLGIGLTVWALVEAIRSMKMRDSVRLNRMFRRRIYAQAFTIVAVVAGSFYWKDDRMKERQYNDLAKEKTRQERREAWLKELEARQEEEDDLRRIRDQVAAGQQGKGRQILAKKEQDGQRQHERQASSAARRKQDAAEDAAWAQQKLEAYAAQNAATQIKSALERGEGASDRPILTAAMALWRR